MPVTRRRRLHACFVLSDLTQSWRLPWGKDVVPPHRLVLLNVLRQDATDILLGLVFLGYFFGTVRTAAARVIVLFRSRGFNSLPTSPLAS